MGLNYEYKRSGKMCIRDRHIPADTVAMGNIEPSSQFKDGTPESIREATLDLMNRCCKKYPNCVISAGCDIPPLVKLENIYAFFAAVKEYYENN